MKLPEKLYAIRWIILVYSVYVINGINIEPSPVMAGYATSTNFVMYPSSTAIITPQVKDQCEDGTDNCTASMAECIAPTPGSYICKCVNGTKGDGYGINGCRDVNECIEDIHDCHANASCRNTNGSYDCSCNTGYSGNGTHCTDIDECQLNIDNCHANATCIKLNGHYECHCLPSFKGNGTYCIDKCSEKQCPSFSSCIIEGENVECRCNNGRYIKTDESGIEQCSLADKIIQVEGLTLDKNFTAEYYDVNSEASRKLKSDVEPAVLALLQSSYDSVTGVQVTKIYKGSVKLDFVAIFASVDGIENSPLPSSSDVTNTFIQDIQNNKLQNISVDISSPPTAKDGNMCEIGGDNCSELENCIPKTSVTFECECKIGYFKHVGSCLLIQEHSRGILSFTLLQQWDPNLSNENSSLFKTVVKDIKNKITTSLRQQIASFNRYQISIHEVTLRKKDERNTNVEAYIVYFNDGTTSAEKIELCNQLNTAQYTDDPSYSAFKFESHDCCFADSFGEDAFKGVYFYDTILRLNYTTKRCKYNGNVTFTRKCEGDGRTPAAWEYVELLPDCKPYSQATEDLLELNEVEICQANQTNNCVSVIETAQNLSAIFTTGEPVNSSYDVSAVSSILEKIMEIATANESVQVAEDILVTVSNVLDIEAEVIQEAEKKNQSASLMLKELDTLTEKLGETIEEGNDIVKSTPNVGIKVANTYAQNYTVIVVVDESSDLSINESHQVLNESLFKGEITIPKSTFENYPGGFEGKVYVIAFRKTSLFVGNTSAEIKAEIQSVVMSVSLGKKKVTGNPAVRLKFKKDDRYNSTDESVCNYWKIAENVTSRWGTSGCRLEGEKDRIVTCGCDHFTHFAILLNIAQTYAKNLVLNVISYIGCGLSLIGLVLTIISHGFNRKLRTKLPSRILVCLSTSLSMVLIVFLAGVDRVEPKLGCQIVAAFLMYFMLSTFIWMGVTAINLYQLIVLVFKRNNTKFFRRANILAWGIPLIIVVISGAVRPESLAPKGDEKPYCFVDGYPFYFGVVVPVISIIIMNLIVLIIILVNLRRSPTVNATGEQSNDIKNQVRIALSCTILLGLTWALGLFAVSELTFTLQLLFCIFNSLQGFIIFILYTLMHPLIKTEIGHYCSCVDRIRTWRQGRYTVKSSSTTGQQRQTRPSALTS